MDQVLSLDTPEGTDYTLHKHADSCWITVDNISVYVIRTNEGVAVDLFAKGCEFEFGPIASTYAFRSEAQEIIDDCESPDRTE